MLDLYGSVEASVGVVGSRIVGILLLALYGALAAIQLWLITGRGQKTERGFLTVRSEENSQVRISIAAIEQLVRQSVRNVEGIAEMKVSIEGHADAMDIKVDASILSGSHVPTITANMQRSIRQFVELNCGVSVNEVSISINSVSGTKPQATRKIGKRKRQDAHANEAPVPVPSTYSEGMVGIPVELDGDSAKKQTDPCDDDSLPEMAPEKQTDVYDFDKPYESEFLKDLEAMRASEGSPEEKRSDVDGNSGV